LFSPWYIWKNCSNQNGGIMWSTTLINKLHIKTKYPTKYESYQTNDLRGIALTKYNYIESAWKCSGAFSSTKIVDSKWQDSMINYISWTIILPNMKAIRPTISEELHSQDITTMKMHQKLWSEWWDNMINYTSWPIILCATQIC
jgi:hypothetical protein